MLFRDVVAKHAALFPEEWYLTSGAHVGDVSGEADEFAQRYMAHLLYYEHHLAHLPTEQMAKATLNIAYHLANNEPLSEDERGSAINALSASLQGKPCIARWLAETDLRAALTAYDSRFTSSDAPIPARADVIIPTDFDNPIDNWHEWCENMYGFSPLQREELERSALLVRAEISSLPSLTSLPITEPIQSAAGRLSTLLGEALDMQVPHAEIQPLPGYLKSMIPSAAAYSFARFETPRRVTLLNMDAPWTLPSLTLLMAHETYAHLWHFAQVDAFASLSRRLPAMYRYACTEGVALLVEEYVATQALDTLSAAVEASFSISRDSIGSELRRTMLTMRLRRILRALFEHHVYEKKKEPEAALAAITPLSLDSIEDMREDLYAYLPTPGYASTYFHGFTLLKNAGASLDTEWRQKIAEAGFDVKSLTAI